MLCFTCHDDFLTQLMKSFGFDALDIDPLGEGRSGIFGKGDQQDLIRAHLVPVQDVFDLPHDGGGFPRSRARDNEVVVFIGDDGGALLKV